VVARGGSAWTVFTKPTAERAQSGKATPRYVGLLGFGTIGTGVVTPAGASRGDRAAGGADRSSHRRSDTKTDRGIPAAPAQLTATPAPC
jgi:hypothetical protein